jgi:four helix bundle protein
MNESELKHRTKQFALRIIKLVGAMGNSATERAIGAQLIRSGTSVGANYRAACRGRSSAEFVARLGIVEEEADESAYWMELLMESDMISSTRILPLHDEASQLVAIMVASRQSANRNRRENKIKSQKSKIKNP